MNRTAFIGTNLCYSQDFVDDLNKEIERLTAESTEWESKFYDEAKIVDKINKLFEADTYIEDIYYAIGILLHKPFYDIETLNDKEILDILKGVDKE